MKKAIGTISTDWHIESSTKDQVIKIILQQCELNEKLGVKDMYCLGDIFNNRKYQRQDELDALNYILNMIDKRGFNLTAIPGNHDKTMYDSSKSFLDSFKYHPSFNLVQESCFKIRHGLGIAFIPFFQNDMWLERLNSIKIDKSINNILFSHIAIEGSINNDGSKVASPIKPSMFMRFDEVYLGHYHNEHDIGANVHHLASIRQGNYGDNNKKGFYILYNDGSVKFIKSKFKEFVKIKVNLDDISKKELDDIIRSNINSDNNVRLEFIGDSPKLKTIDKVKLNNFGIDVKTKCKEIEDSIDFIDSNEVQTYGKSEIIVLFTDYCKKNDLDIKTGLFYLNKKFND